MIICWVRWMTGCIEDERKDICWFVSSVCSSDHNHARTSVRDLLVERFLGKIIISIGCLHSYQGLFYIVLNYFGGIFCCHVIPGDIRARKYFE